MVIVVPFLEGVDKFVENRAVQQHSPKCQIHSKKINKIIGINKKILLQRSIYNYFHKPFKFYISKR